MTGYMDHFDFREDDFGKKHPWLHALGVCLILITVFLALVYITSAAMLSISGHSAGAGIHSLQFSGELLNATLTQNNSSDSWKLLVGGSL